MNATITETETEIVQTMSVDAQEGPQKLFLACDADIVIYGGAAGGGKTWSLLAQNLQYFMVPGFHSVIFRRVGKQITDAGGLRDESVELFPQFGGKWSAAELQWTFEDFGSTVSFRHLQNENDKFNWMGAQICYIGFDELTHFTESQFFFLMSRNRSTCGVKPFIRATCNPIPKDDPVGGWVHRLIQWWIDPVSGFPIEERGGVIRWMLRRPDGFHFADTREELVEKFRREDLPLDHARQPKPKPVSITFIPATLEDNKILMEKDPDYEAKLDLMAEDERQRNREGNWNAKMYAGMFFKIGMVKIEPAAPKFVRMVRGWDLAATDGSGDWTAGPKLGLDEDGLIWIVDMRRGQWETTYRDRMILTTAQLDGRNVEITIPEDPAAAGKSEAQRMIRMLNRYTVVKKHPSKNKQLRARPFASQFNAGNVRLLEADWNAGLLSRLDSFPTKGIADDEIDGLADAYDQLVGGDSTVVVGTGRPKDADLTEDKPAAHPYKAMIAKEDDGGNRESSP